MEEREKNWKQHNFIDRRKFRKNATPQSSPTNFKWKNGIIIPRTEETKCSSVFYWFFIDKRQGFTKKECQTSAGKDCAWWCLHFKSYLYIETHEILNLYADFLSAHITNNVVEVIIKKSP